MKQTIVLKLDNIPAGYTLRPERVYEVSDLEEERWLDAIFAVVPTTRARNFSAHITVDVEGGPLDVINYTVISTVPIEGKGFNVVNKGSDIRYQAIVGAEVIYQYDEKEEALKAQLQESSLLSTQSLFKKEGSKSESVGDIKPLAPQ